MYLQYVMGDRGIRVSPVMSDRGIHVSPVCDG